MSPACFGGTFDPPHIGHELMVREVLRTGTWNQVIVIPVSQPAHKEIEHPVDPVDRLHMSRLAFEPIAGCVVDDTEIVRGGVSYTVETVKEIKERQNIAGKIGMIIGFDLVPGLPTWKHWEELKQQVHLIITRRDSREIDRSVLEGCEYSFLENPLIDTSSRMIREKCSRGEPIDAYVSPAVAAYIRERGLYGYV